MINGITISISLLALLMLMGTFLSLYIRSKYSKAKDTDKKQLVKIHEIINPNTNDLLIDLGAGDFRIPFFFSANGISSTGVEISPLHILYSKIQRYFRYRSQKKSRVLLNDMYSTDITEYSIIYLNHSEEILEDIGAVILSKLPKQRKVFTYKRPIKGSKYLAKHKLDQEIHLYEYRT